MRRLGWTVLAALAPLLLWHVDTWHTPNPTSRALLTISLVEDHSYRIDRFKDWTEDKALVQGHYYSDKAPLSSWLAVPVYALSTALTGKTSETFPRHSAIYSGALVSGVLPALLFIALLWQALVRAGASPTLSVLYVFAAVPASLVGLYAGTFFGHVLGGLLLLVGWKALFDDRRPFLAGLALGFSGTAEFPLLLFVPFFVLGTVMNCPEIRVWRRLISLALGLAPGALLIAGHNLLTTGSPLVFAYKYVDSPSFEHMHSYYGFKLPSPEALWGLMFSRAHGILFHVPVVAVLLLATVWKRPLLTSTICVRMAGILAYILLVSSYQMWEGGWAFGPRHLVPIVMLLLYEGAKILPKKLDRFWAGALSLSVAAGGSLVFLAKSTVVYMISTQVRFPLVDLFIPNFLAGKLNNNVLPTMFWGMSPQLAHILWAHAVVFAAAWLCKRALLVEQPS